ncbi:MULTISPECIES: TetR/AcrR family transcriptional regulator [Cellulomonas]|uniref:AcrR family transcriptional regulator n=1 Tax=Cellulomonas iranensis TaxID=76862 RepID=A0ABU0GL42_9CELL|nr:MULTISPECIES: TetR/AcrR family transcriptional regulator [Cellulomonas]MDQ0426043.1 AcrR family transcriptional regulator [Cellulomonas iranensis]TFH68213.1 TetR/AcrR family transcriptional regulator [Cellulomonas sp. HD19AZ1]
MAWDTAGTRRRLLDAGARQFAARGFAGTTMDALSRDAGVNKERVYAYFGDKRGLFGAVLADRLGGLLDGAQVEGTGPAAVGAWAGELFDRYRRTPDLARLLAWESLELDEAASADHRAATCRDRATHLRAALPGLDAARAQHLLLSVVTLVTGWWTLARLGDVVLTAGTSTGPDDAADARRAALVAQVEALAGAA